MKKGVERSLILGLLANWAFTEKEKRRPRWWLRLVTYTRYPHGLFYSTADVVARGCFALWPKNAENFRLQIFNHITRCSDIIVFCNSNQSILTLHSIHSTSNPSLYCGYEHWPMAMFIILSVTRGSMIVFRLSITREWRESRIWTTHMNSLRRPWSPRKTSLLASMCSSLVSWFEIYLGANIIFWNNFTEERKEYPID